MATYQTGAVVSRNSFYPFPNGTCGVRRGIYNGGASLVANDVVEMVPVYKGERVLYMRLICTAALDSGSSLVLDVGDGANTNRYIASSTRARTGGIDLLSTGSAAALAKRMDHVYAADDTIDVKVMAAAGTAKDGRLIVEVLVAA